MLKKSKNEDKGRNKNPYLRQCKDGRSLTCVSKDESVKREEDAMGE
jgi:hypothetical protein